MAGSKTSLQRLQRHLWVKQRHQQVQPGTAVRPGFGAGREAGTGAVWGFASGAAAPAGAESADRGGQTDGGVNSGGSEPVLLVAAPATVGGWRGSLRLCTVQERPQAERRRWPEPGRSKAPPETNLSEPPV